MPSIAVRLREMRDSHRDSSLRPSPLQIDVHPGRYLAGRCLGWPEAIPGKLKCPAAQGSLLCGWEDNVIGLDQANSSRVVDAAHDGGISACCQSYHDGRFSVVGGLKHGPGEF